MKSGIISLTCVGVGVKLPTTKPPSPNSVEESLRMTRSDKMDQGALGTLLLSLGSLAQGQNLARQPPLP